MKTCPQEERVRRIKRSDRTGKDLEKHIDSCVSCRELALVSQFMGEIGEETLKLPHRLPDPGPLWWKAQLIQKWDRESRATQPVELMQTVTHILGILLPGAALVWMGRQALSYFSRMMTDFPLSMLGETSFGTFSAVELGVVFIMVTLLVTLRIFLLED